MGEKLATLLHDAINLIYVEVFKELTDLLNPLFPYVISIYIIITAYFWLFNYIDHAKGNLIRVLFLFPLVIGSLFNITTYNEYVPGIILTVKDTVLYVITSIVGKENIFQYLDTVFLDAYTEVSKNLWKGGILQGIVDTVLGLGIILSFGLLYLYLLFYLLFSDILVKLLLMIGPIFLALFCFNGTKAVAIGWFKTMFMYVMWAGLAALYLVFIIAAISHTMQDTTNTTMSIFTAILVNIFFIIAINKIPELTNNIIGGMTSGFDGSSGGLFRWGSFMGAKAKDIVKNK